MHLQARSHGGHSGQFPCYVQAIPPAEFRAFLTRWLAQRLRAEENCW